jgi:hypothetical protein
MLIGQAVIAAFIGFSIAWIMVAVMIWIETDPFKKFNGCCSCGGEQVHGATPSKIYDNVCQDCEPWFTLARRYDWSWDETQTWVNKAEREWDARQQMGGWQ